MTIPIYLKRSTVASKIPATTDLSQGEFAWNVNDGKLYGKQTTGGVDTILRVGPVDSVAGRQGNVTLTSTDVGLGNVNNTSDVNKPTSTAQLSSISSAIATLTSSLASSTGATNIAYQIASAAGCVTTTLNGIWSQVINARDFGMLGNGVDVTTNMANLRAYVASLGTPVKVQFPAGNYVYSTSPNWAIRGLVMEFLGQVFFTNTGSGYAFIVDGGSASPARVDDFSIGSEEAPLTVRGSSTTGGGIYARAILTSSIHARVYGCGTASAGLRTEWCVLCNFDVRVCPNDMSTGSEAWYSSGKPTAGYSLSQRGTGEQTSYCKFTAPYTAACGTGIYLDSTLGNLFIGGDSEYNTSVGLLTSANALNDMFLKTNFEQNATDMSIYGQYIELIGCDSVTAVIQTGAKNIQLKGGNWDAIQVNSGALNTFIGNVKYGRGLTGSVITDSGTNTCFSNNFNLATGHVENAPKALVTITPTTGTYLYQNTTGNTQMVSVTGGTVSAISYKTAAGAVNSLGAISGSFMIMSGDYLQVQNTVVPTMLVYKGF